MIIELVKVVASIALGWLMFIEGLGIDLRQLLALRRRFLLLLRAFVAIDLLVPLAAWSLIVWIDPQRIVAGAVALLAACPIAPLALRRITKAAGEREAAAAIHLLLAVPAIVTTPVTLSILGSALGFAAKAPLLSIARQIALLLVLPLLAGIAIGAGWPKLAARLRHPGGKIAVSLLVVVVVMVIVEEAGAFLELELRDYALMGAFVAAALAIGHLAGGRGADRRTVFALECASRNIGLAFFIASVQPQQRSALPILVPYLVVFALISSLYLGLGRVWRGRGSGDARGG